MILSLGQHLRFSALIPVKHLEVSQENVLCKSRLFLMFKHHVTGIRQTDFQISYRNTEVI